MFQISEKQNCLFLEKPSASVLSVRSLMGVTALVFLLLSFPAYACIGKMVTLNPSLSEKQDVLSHSISPDNRYVVYRADQDIDGVSELFSIPIAGGRPIKLNAELATNGNVSDFAISPDSRYVVYRADQDLDSEFELFSVSIRGGRPVRLNPNFGQEHQDVLTDFKISPDSTRVFYRATVLVDLKVELFSSLISGGGGRQHNLRSTSSSVVGFAISPNSSHLVFTEQSFNEFGGVVEELYSVATSGGSPLMLHRPRNQGIIYQYKVSPDGSRVFFTADLDVTGQPGLYSTLITGGQFGPHHLRLAGAGPVRSFKIHVESEYVVFIQINRDGARELYRSSAVNFERVTLNSDLPDGGNVNSFDLGADGRFVVYDSDQETANFDELYSVGIRSGVVNKLSSDTAVDEVKFFKVSPDSSYVVYQIERERGTRLPELISVPIEGGSIVPLKLEDNLELLNRFDFNSRGDHILFAVNSRREASSYVLNLFVVSLFSGAKQQVNLELPLDGRVRGFSSSSDGAHIVYIADQNIQGVRELFSVSIVEDEFCTIADEEICVPIRTVKGSVAVVCL